MKIEEIEKYIHRQYCDNIKNISTEKLNKEKIEFTESLEIFNKYGMLDIIDVFISAKYPNWYYDTSKQEIL